MKFDEHFKEYRKWIKDIAILIYGQIILFLLALAFNQQAHLVGKSILIFCIIGGVLFARKIIQKNLNVRIEKQESLLKEYGSKEIMASFGLNAMNKKVKWNIEKYIIACIYGCFLLIIFFVIYAVGFELQGEIVGGLLLFHISAYMIMIHKLIKAFAYEYIFIDEGIVCHHTTIIQYSEISKHQFIPLVKEDYMFDLNSGKQFIRMRLKAEEYKIISRLFSISEA